MKKNKLLLMGAVLLLCAVIMPALKAERVNAAAADGFISVTGCGYVNVKPDTAYVTIGVKTSAEAAEVCYTQNTGKINGIIAAIEKTGVKAADIQNTCHSLYQDYDRYKPYDKAPHYTASNMLRVKVRDLDILSQVYAAAVEAGANADYGLQFALENKEAACAEALGKAIKNARDKAEVLARSADLTLGNAYEIIESPSFSGYVSCAGGVSEAALKTFSAETVRAGEISVEARVAVKYAC